ncbi:MULTISPECIES: response regulator transcription factor [Mucilaginibacter]|jgi:two-component system alkaline phosphatase synthesis response regulator PhoP|uniref:Phosphate regulon transcriptional regulatory protein PhoB n=1 Tax=Mucilaginibacter lappiensis TaxID=354630 RepID=A0A1N6Y531_9SPHI|nr:MULTISPECIES: response regulator transcription factor [Mucilaginibacter]MBB6109620.1 two-component system alkaline phosphatase synthesis response regulator PhoP [Mucilaginibacter lappiensis]MBB6128923.1 two-component system alkaline phosphatase synthesis response regulator PhoP [Mucilaginibacter lappiensis]NHA07063.1 response regulator transcription factor [Mucilaginibacter inviolabilis]SDP24965.1 two-component system, OmpR family, alkaline phosphatase synthesis response regulator PhoP [Muci
MSNSSKQKILIVDDEPDILELIEYNLKKEGYQVFLARNGQEAVAEAKKSLPDLIVLDIMMPKMDGIEACRIMRTMPEFKNTFMVFLTARSEEYSEIAGFNVGADDYIAKPIKPRALVSRINAILRRNAPAEDTPDNKLEIGNLVIDREAYLVYKDGVKVVLAKKEFELLYLLASKPGKVYTREVILKNIWEDSVVVTNRTIDVHIRKLREKLGDDCVATVKGVGYKFEA